MRPIFSQVFLSAILLWLCTSANSVAATQALSTSSLQPALNLSRGLAEGVRDFLSQRPGQSAATTLERGELSLLTRAWLADHATATLDVQYFIWTADNVGRLAMDALLRAADRGVKVRVLVDDFMLTMPGEMLLALDQHPRIDIRVYNPNTRTGVGFLRRLWNALFSFRAVNQRMHNKALIVDQLLAVTGGRNLADEYYDFHHGFNFRDRDVLVGGPVVESMSQAFETYWASHQARPIHRLLDSLPPEQGEEIRRDMAAYAADSTHFAPDVRKALADLPKRLEQVISGLAWGDVRFITDAPGKNPGLAGLRGGGETTLFLAELLRSAQKQVTIQSPYLIPDDTTLGLFRELTRRGVKIRIHTNSLANNDNLQAMSGYLKRRKQILAAGVEIFEFKPYPGIQKSLLERLGKHPKGKPVFVLHAKTMVVDGEKTFIGTFNLDPRSMHLNTESGILLTHAGIAREVESAIEADMAPENSWQVSQGNGDAHASLLRRIQVRLWALLPIEPIL